jgi:hypothetical protein
VAKTNSLFSKVFTAKPPTNLIGPTETARTTKKATVGQAEAGLKTASFSAKDLATGINFGSSSRLYSSSSTGSQWPKLLEQAASGGIASIANSATGVGALGGLGAVVSGIMKLFGGGGNSSTLPPLVSFTLPNTTAETVYVNAPAAPKPLAARLQQTPAAIPASKPANTPPAVTATYSNAHVVQAVKNALLTSSSLNDVISEI